MDPGEEETAMGMRSGAKNSSPARQSTIKNGSNVELDVRIRTNYFL
jgi:hypothetical protein